MKLCVQACLAACCLVTGANAQVNLPTVAAARSRSGQFTVYAGRRPSSLPNLLRFPGNTNLVRLEPTLLAVSCERIKQDLLSELGAADQWRGKIRLVLHPAENPDETIVVTSSRFANGWMYQVELPDAVEPSRFVRALVRVLLLEWANRGAGERPVEIPLWLGEGLSQQILTASRTDLVIQPSAPATVGLPQRSAATDARRFNPLARAHEQLRSRPLLTVEELSWPKEEELAGAAAETFRSAAQLFVHELLRLKDGRACLRTMLGALAQHLNWQTAFLRAFGAHFEQPLDLEKWWALQLVQFTGRELAQIWPGDESWRKLDEILRTPIQLDAATNEPPQRVEVTLQTIVREWDYERQSRVLQTKVQQLQMLRPRVAQPLAALADDYRQALDACLQRMRKTGMARTAGPPRPAVRKIIEQTVEQLDALDARREVLRQSQAETAQPQPENSGNP